MTGINVAEMGKVLKFLIYKFEEFIIWLDVGNKNEIGIKDDPRDIILSTRKDFPGSTVGKESICQCRRRKRGGFGPWVGKIPWSRKWQPTPVFLPGKFHGQRSQVGYCPWVYKGSDTTEHTCTHQEGWVAIYGDAGTPLEEQVCWGLEVQRCFCLFSFYWTFIIYFWLENTVLFRGGCRRSRGGTSPFF